MLRPCRLLRERKTLADAGWLSDGIPLEPVGGFDAVHVLGFPSAFFVGSR
jgi:hypothetical protein